MTGIPVLIVYQMPGVCPGGISWLKLTRTLTLPQSKCVSCGAALCGFIVICCCFCCIIFYTQISDIEEIMSKVMYGGIVGSVNFNMNKYRN